MSHPPIPPPGRGGSSEQYFIRVSADTLAGIASLAETAPRTLDAAGNAQVDELQRALRRFGQIHITQPEALMETALYQRIQNQFDELGTLAEAEGQPADEEAARANETAGLLT